MSMLKDAGLCKMMQGVASQCLLHHEGCSPAVTQTYTAGVDRPAPVDGNSDPGPLPAVQATAYHSDPCHPFRKYFKRFYTIIIEKQPSWLQAVLYSPGVSASRNNTYAVAR